VRLVIEIPDEYAEAVRAALDRAGYNDAPDQVRRVLRYSIRDFLTAWHGERHTWRLRRFDEADGRLAEELPARPAPPAPADMRRQTVMPVTAFGEIADPAEGAGAAGRAVVVSEGRLP